MPVLASLKINRDYIAHDIDKSSQMLRIFIKVTGSSQGSQDLQKTVREGQSLYIETHDIYLTPKLSGNEVLLYASIRGQHQVQLISLNEWEKLSVVYNAFIRVERVVNLFQCYTETQEIMNKH